MDFVPSSFGQSPVRSYDTTAGYLNTYEKINAAREHFAEADRQSLRLCSRLDQMMDRWPQNKKYTYT